MFPGSFPDRVHPGTPASFHLFLDVVLRSRLCEGLGSPVFFAESRSTWLCLLCGWGVSFSLPHRVCCATLRGPSPAGPHISRRAPHLWPGPTSPAGPHISGWAPHLPLGLWSGILCPCCCCGLISQLSHGLRRQGRDPRTSTTAARPGPQGEIVLLQVLGGHVTDFKGRKVMLCPWRGRMWDKPTGT